ncbi:MAG: biotin/lipoyl-containing protein, partial [Longimicrobiales bacterium]
MATKVHMEALSPTMEEGQLVKWLKNEGDTVAEGDVLAEIETDKATMELVARGSGVLQGVKLKAGDTAPVGEVIAMIAGEGDDVVAAPEGGAEDRAEQEAEPRPDKSPPPADAARGSEAAGRPEDEERMTPAAEETGTADKAEGAEPKEARREPVGAKVAQPEAMPEKEEAQEPDDRGEGRGDRGNGREGRVKASPLARRLAEEAGVELAGVEGTGPGGRITKRDIESAAQAGTAAAGA